MLRPGLMVLALAGTAVAADPGPAMPVYDVETICRGEPEQRSCVEAQYAARTMSAGVWLDVSPQARAECAKVNRWGDYGLLWTCLYSHKKADGISGG